jgi:hypothetical protein
MKGGLRLQVERDGLASAVGRFLFSQLRALETRLVLIQLGFLIILVLGAAGFYLMRAFAR